MKIKRTIANDSITASEIDFTQDLAGIPKKDHKSILSEVGELLVEQTLHNLADSKSPVSGAAYKKTLSKDYGKKKEAETGSKAANLDLTGDMINSIDFEIDGDTLLLGVFGDDAPKADGHNNLSGKSDLPERRFLPKKGESYKREISSLIEEVIANKRAETVNLKDSKLSKIESKSELYEYLQKELGIDSKLKIKNAILSSELSIQLEEFDLLKYL